MCQAASERLDADQFHLKNQRRIRTNILTHPSFAVRESRRNPKLISWHRTFIISIFGPAFDNAIDREGRGLLAFEGTIEFSSIESRAPDNWSRPYRFPSALSGSLFQDLVLQPAGGRFHPVLLFVFREELLTGRRIFLSGFLLGRLLFFHHFFLQSRHRFLDLVLRQKRLGAANSVFYALQEHVGINIYLLPARLNPTETDAVADFVFLVFELC